MPYLEPEHVLRQFAGYLQDDVRDAIEDEHKFVEAQVGSMSSSLNFLARELDSLNEDLAAQRRALLEALDDVEAALEQEGGSPTIERAIETARDSVRNADPSNGYEYERVLTGAATDVLNSLEDLDDQSAAPVRRPLYSYMNARVKTQLEALGAER
jgi:hypothetical protein